jgi:hypothetical protein|eukprot:COSAG02_NODE_379_length_23528_cov_140.781510_15_plen_253_part_00
MMRACCAAPRGEAKRARRRATTAPADENLRLSPASANANPQVALSPEQQELKKTISPSVRASPVARIDDIDSPRNRCSSEPLGVEHLRERTGRAALMFRDIRSPARSTSLLQQQEVIAEVEEEQDADDGKDEFVEIVVPSLPDERVRLVNVLLGDGSQVEVDVPGDVQVGETYVVNVADELRRQRRQKFLDEDATRAELLQEIEFLSWSLTATVAAVKIQAFVRRRQYRLIVKQNTAALMDLIREARSAQTS